MNPYLEQARSWHDFHERYIPKAAEQYHPAGSASLHCDN